MQLEVMMSEAVIVAAAAVEAALEERQAELLEAVRALAAGDVRGWTAWAHDLDRLQVAAKRMATGDLVTVYAPQRGPRWWCTARVRGELVHSSGPDLMALLLAACPRPRPPYVDLFGACADDKED